MKPPFPKSFNNDLYLRLADIFVFIAIAMFVALLGYLLADGIPLSGEHI
jgi:hypothetical protein